MIVVIPVIETPRCRILRGDARPLTRLRTQLRIGQQTVQQRFLIRL